MRNDEKCEIGCKTFTWEITIFANYGRLWYLNSINCSNIMTMCLLLGRGDCQKNISTTHPFECEEWKNVSNFIPITYDFLLQIFQVVQCDFLWHFSMRTQSNPIIHSIFSCLSLSFSAFYHLRFMWLILLQHKKNFFGILSSL